MMRLMTMTMAALMAAGAAQAAERGSLSDTTRPAPFSPAPAVSAPGGTAVQIAPATAGQPYAPAPMIRHDPAAAPVRTGYTGPGLYAGPAGIDLSATSPAAAPATPSAPLVEETPAPPRKARRPRRAAAEAESNDSGLPPPAAEAPVPLPVAAAAPVAPFAIPEGVDPIDAILKQVYTARNYAPLWVENGAPTARAAALLAAAAKAGEEGLDPTAYDLAAVQTAQATVAADPAPFDLAVSRVALRYGSDLMGGRLVTLADKGRVRIGPASVDNGILAAALTAADPVALLHDRPNRNPAYKSLLPQLAAHRALVANGGWPVVPEAGGKLEPGETSERMPAIRARLAVTDGPLATPAVGAENIYDDDLKAAVIRFQNRHGLIADGVIGSKTMTAMNVSAADRLMQIEVTLERLRASPEPSTDPYVYVNIPGFYMQIVDKGQKVDEQGVVTGRPGRATPQFAGEIWQIVLNPPWGVPARLAREDILPRLKRNPEGVAAGGFRIYDREGNSLHPTDIDWSNYSAGHFPFTIRQAPGDDNALGLMKLNIRNDFDIYLHDTHDRHLFARDLRAYSSGCIRMSRPVDVVAWTLSSEEGWDRGRIEGLLGGKTRYIDLKNRKPMAYIKYMTAWTLPDGRLAFRNDEYGHDKRIAEALKLGQVAVTSER